MPELAASGTRGWAAPAVALPPERCHSDAELHRHDAARCHSTLAINVAWNMQNRQSKHAAPDGARHPRCAEPGSEPSGGTRGRRDPRPSAPDTEPSAGERRRALSPPFSSDGVYGSNTPSRCSYSG